MKTNYVKFLRGFKYKAKFIEKDGQIYLISQIKKNGFLVFNGSLDNAVPLVEMTKLFTPKELKSFDVKKSYVNKIIEFHTPYIYALHDKVFDAAYGWGVITSIRAYEKYPLTVTFERGEWEYTSNGKSGKMCKLPSLSFTEYDYVNGGFSQEKN